MRGRSVRWCVIALAASVLVSTAAFAPDATLARGADAVSTAVAPVTSRAHDLVLTPKPHSVLDRVAEPRASHHGWPLALAVLAALSIWAAGSPRRSAILLLAADGGVRLSRHTRTRAPPFHHVPA